MRIEAIVFDFDGLLMDTETTLLDCWQYEWRQHGLELDQTSFFADHGGDITAERYRQLAEAVGPGYDYESSHARRTAYRQRLHDELGLCDGIEEWLAQAHDVGLRCAIASSSPEHWVTEMLQRINHIDDFTTLATGDEVPAVKPAPDVYLLAIERLGLQPAQAVAVEDTPHGVAAAKAAGLPCIAIPNPFADPARFTAADLVLPSAAALPLLEAVEAVESLSFAR
ncbi:HAD family hydrolase [Actinospica robiniae]|uniref:HAD family hydrolase n=1 Tax=Actinospica robiniae TaxID=304901 RepID=UPI0003F87685|nr:HAD-IA family hydrolase [Actinospica robiniae]